MTDITHTILSNQFSDNQSVIYRGQYFLMKKLFSVLAGSMTPTEKTVAINSLTNIQGSVFGNSNPSFFANANANIEAALQANTVASITDEDYAAAADTIWAAYVAAYG